MIPENIKAVIFDLDGLLIDSEPAWRSAHATVLERRGFSFTEEFRRKVHGAGHAKVAEIYKQEYGIEDSAEDIIKELRKTFYDMYLQEPLLMEGAKECLKSFFDKGLILAAATGNGPREGVLLLLEELEILQYFRIVVTDDEVSESKPSPVIYLTTAEKLGVVSNTCLVLEDSVNGVRAGSAAGMTVFGVNPNKEIQKKLVEAGADKVFSSLNEII